MIWIFSSSRLCDVASVGAGASLFLMISLMMGCDMKVIRCGLTLVSLLVGLVDMIALRRLSKTSLGFLNTRWSVGIFDMVVVRD